MTIIAEGLNSIVKWLNGSQVIHSLKQIFGIQDKIQYTFERYGKTYASDTKSKVGLGPKRSSENRFIGHDVINALPDSWQMPTIAAVTTVIGAGIVAATNSGPVRMALLSLLTTGMGIASAQIVDDKVIAKFSDNIIGVFRKAANLVVDVLFGSGLFGDRGFGSTLS